MPRSHPLAVRPALPTLAAHAQALDRDARQALERRYQQVLSLGIRADLAQRLVSAVHLATLQTVDETLWAAELLKALRAPALATPDVAEFDALLRAQYLATVESLVAVANQEALRWLLEE